MRFSLIGKFISSFLITGAVLVGILVSVIQFFASKNFSDYVAQKDHRNLDNLVLILEKAYKEKGGWGFIEHNHQQWIQMLRLAGLITEAPPPPPPDNWDSGPPRPWATPNELGPRISLLDQNKTLVMGRGLADDKYLRPIPDHGAVIGYLGFNRAPNLSHPLDTEFLKQQKKGFFLAGILFLACSVLVSAILAFHLLSPIRKLSRATKELGRRRFDTRITLKTGDELGQLAEDFNRMAVTLGAYEKRQIQWISDISHELRTPLSILKGELEAVQDGIRPLDRQAIDALHAEVQHLIRLVSDLHDLSMAEAGMMQLLKEELDLSPLLSEIADRFAARLARHGFQITRQLQPGTMVKGDPDRLTQLFSNLLENALAYTDHPGQIRITCRIRSPHIVAMVENSGPGVPADTRPRLFDRLFRADSSRNRKNGGSGLGLAICRHIAQAHQGNIQALESPLGGINMEVCLPGLTDKKGEPP